MNKRPFMAANWLGNTAASKNELLPENNSLAQARVHEQSPAQAQEVAPKQAFSIGNYVIPQWKGESLLTKDALKLKNIIKELYCEASKLVKTFPSRNKTLKLTVYNQFMAYVESECLNASEINDYNLFWSHYLDKHSPHRATIQKFLDIYCLRAVNVYLLKTRFLKLLSQVQTKQLSTIDLLNPDSAIAKFFKKASSTELRCEALSNNHFSWFRPSSEMATVVTKLSAILSELGSVEFLKVCNHEVPVELGLKLEDKDFEIFSHAISNRNFGLFINDLLIYIPEWIENHDGYFNFDSEPKCLNTLFTGEFLNSLALSHWLAQENNVNKKWEDVICPDFKGRDFKTGDYLKVCQELQFLTFLVKMSAAQGHNPVSLICSLFKQKNAKAKTDALGQMSIFDAATNNDQADESIYDRVVINCTQLPKKNPHHYLLTQIHNTGEKLANNGYMYIFSNQKLFVPSHSEKVEGLLNKYKLHARVNFEDLKGKGEVAKYLYVFSKRVFHNRMDLYSNTMPKLQKESCLSLNFQGQLSHFSKFGNLREEFHKFITSKETINSPLFQVETEPGIFFEFHQDAILNGKLLSNNGDSNNITHPSYFKKLTRTCIPFDQFFIVESLSAKSENYTSDLLGLAVKAEERFPYLLIVNFSNEHDISVELTTADLFKAKVEEYGNAYFQYFGLIPKVGNLNINLFREFFDTSVGKQIIQLTFNGGLKKTKSKLKAMLVPKFIMETDTLPEHHAQTLNIFTLDKTRLLSLDLKNLVEEIKNSRNMVSILKQKYPWHVSCILSRFKYLVEEALTEIKSGSSDSLAVNYSNPAIMSEVVTLDKYPIYPVNEDLYLEASLRERNDIHLPLTHTKLVKSDTGHSLELYSEAAKLFSMHGEHTLLHFAQFILTNAAGVQISKILQSLELPAASDLKSIVERHNEVESSLEEAIKESHQQLNDIIIGQIFNS
ncbi:hypothetical protein [Bacteriovorax sp. DB6_IX]|uniref:hypothetical protein n=1 Tax=Bacteriovorax sp. DB6_IX TaxID=1353530 RepID=UPI00038A3F76|nr:hypothetical protein [Bacteriovorax sp. DB6_IX]EQC50549.1 hypothetical protein M901_2321 [Bacteriovorax sp. DB6_IX]